MDTLLQDLRYGFRQLLKSPGFTAAAVLSLALGIGANTALFSLVDAVLLKTLPVKRPEELVLFKTQCERMMAISHSGTINRDPATGLRVGSSFSYPAFQDFRAQTETLSDVFAFAPSGDLNVNVDGQAEIAKGQLVTGGFYSALGVQTLLGRTIAESDDETHADPVAVISHRYWQLRFGLDEVVLGKTITINNVPVTIIGITPPQFYGGLEVGDSPDISMPLALEPRLRQSASEMHESWYWWVRMMGRMRPGTTANQVHAELEGVFQQSALAGWNAAPPSRRPPDWGPRELPTLQVLSGKYGEVYLRQSYEQPLRILMIVVGLVLLIACANIANLLLARAARRRQEIAVRLALGARRFRLIRQLLTESILLALLGGALGLLLAWWLKDLLLMWSPGRGSQLEAELKLDWRVFCFTAAVALLTGVLFGLAPALRATRVDLNSALKENTRGARGSLSLLGKSLVVGQVAAALLLLVGAGLFVRTLHNLQSVELGFNADNLLYFRVDPRAKGYRSEQIGPLCQQLIERIEALPGVRSATISEFTLLSGAGRSGPAYPQGRPLSEADSGVFQQRVRWNYLETMEIPLLAGRGLTSQDDERSPRVAVINQTMARRFFGDEAPLGKRFGFGRVENSGDIEVVGVARDSRYSRPRQGVPSIAYLPFPQNALGMTTFAVRTAGDPGMMLASIRRTVRDVDKDLPVFDIKTQIEQVERSLTQERFFPKLTGFFGLLALVLAAVGLYGVMSYSVAQRTHEIAIRMALGATEQSILRRVAGQGMLMAIIGIGIGTAAALGLTRFIASFLFGVGATDPATFVTISFALITVALGACLVPARRATRVDPMVALRYE
jgi:predicted permease